MVNKKDCEYSQSFLRGSSAADKCLGPVSVEAPVWVKEEVPCSFLASVIHELLDAKNSWRFMKQPKPLERGGLIEEAIRKIKNRAPEGQRGFSNTDYSL